MRDANVKSLTMSLRGKHSLVILTAPFIQKPINTHCIDTPSDDEPSKIDRVRRCETQARTVIAESSVCSFGSIDTHNALRTATGTT